MHGAPGPHDLRDSNETVTPVPSPSPPGVPRVVADHGRLGNNRFSDGLHGNIANHRSRFVQQDKRDIAAFQRKRHQSRIETLYYPHCVLNGPFDAYGSHRRT